MIRYRRLYESINPSGLNFQKKSDPHYRDVVYEANVIIDDKRMTFCAVEGSHVGGDDNYLAVAWYCPHDGWSLWEKVVDNINSFGKEFLDIYRYLMERSNQTDHDLKNADIRRILRDKRFEETDIDEYKNTKFWTIIGK